MTSGAPTETAAASAAAPTPQRIGVPREIFPGEKRVATVPEAVVKLIKLGFGVVVESGAGALANLSDDHYREAGASIAPTAAELWSGSDIVFKVRAPTPDEVALMHERWDVFPRQPTPTSVDGWPRQHRACVFTESPVERSCVLARGVTATRVSPTADPAGMPISMKVSSLERLFPTVRQLNRSNAATR